jgi:hypothetical protein
MRRDRAETSKPICFHTTSASADPSPFPGVHHAPRHASEQDRVCGCPNHDHLTNQQHALFVCWSRMSKKTTGGPLVPPGSSLRMPGAQDRQPPVGRVLWSERQEE